MPYPILEILAGLLIALVLIKLAVVLIDTRSWLRFVRGLYARPALTAGIAFALALGVLALLIAAGMSILQVLAVSLFVLLLIVAGLAPYAGGLLAWVEKMSVREALRRQWLYILIWLVLIGWGLFALLMAR
jgi:hypothetical protein